MTNKDNWEDYEELQDQINIIEESGILLGLYYKM